MNVGIVGCGVISREYARNAQHFDAYDVTVCADAVPEAAQKLADEHGLRRRRSTSCSPTRRSTSCST